MRKTKVMFVLLQIEAGGSERVVLDLAQNLDSERFEIYVATFKGGVLEPSFAKVCKKIFFIEKKAGFDIFAMLKIASIVKRYGIDVVNAHHYMPLFYSFMGAKLLNRKRLIYTEHSVPEVEGIANGRHGKILNRLFFKLDKLIGVSSEITETFRKRYPIHENKFVTVLNGVDIEKYSSAGSTGEARILFGLSQDHFVVGTVANFRRIKNHVCLVRAAARLKDAYPNLRLLFVGTGFPGDVENSEDEVQALIKDLNLQDRVIFAGYQENIPEILSAFDVFCLPSVSEGLPVSVLEAMAAGVPVVGSEVRGIKELVHNRETGLLFMSNNDADLAGRLEEFINSSSLSRYIASRAFDYVEKNHSKKAWMNQLIDIFVDQDKQR